MKVELCLPSELPPKAYFDCRFAVLRGPLGFPKGAEILADDDKAIHAWVCENETVVTVGRAHLIAEESDGSCSDHAGPDAGQCPGFSVLETGSAIRPAIHIRQMGTRKTARRRGYAKAVLSALEKSSHEHFSARLGLLQARVESISFYESQDWMCFDDTYFVQGIGPHRSMRKHLGD